MTQFNIASRTGSHNLSVQWPSSQQWNITFHEASHGFSCCCFFLCFHQSSFFNLLLVWHPIFAIINCLQILCDIHNLQPVATDAITFIDGVYICGLSFSWHFGVHCLQIIRLARKLPTGDVNALKAKNATEEDDLDEDDLT